MNPKEIEIVLDEALRAFYPNEPFFYPVWLVIGFLVLGFFFLFMGMRYAEKHANKEGLDVFAGCAMIFILCIGLALLMVVDNPSKMKRQRILHMQNEPIVAQAMSRIRDELKTAHAKRSLEGVDGANVVVKKETAK